MSLATYRQEIGDLDGAERDARRLLARDPRLSPAHSLLGLVAEKRGDARAAIAHFQAALALEPGSVPLRAKLAELALRAGDVTRARELYEAMLAEGVLDDSPAQLARAATLDAMLGNLPRAEASLRRVVALEPSARHHFSLALILVQQGKRGEAAAAMEAALAATDPPLDPPQKELARQALAQLRAGS
jgi:type IV pilus assembly protein PilF